MFQLFRQQNAVQPQRHPEQVAVELNEQELAEISGSSGDGGYSYSYSESYSRYGWGYDDGYDRYGRHHHPRWRCHRYRY